jgi:hypothetical protein
MLDGYLDRLQGGDLSFEELVRGLAPDAKELKSLLLLSTQIEQALKAPEPSAEFLRNSPLRLMNRLRAKQGAPMPRQVHRQPRRFNLLRAAPALASVFLILALLLGSIGVVTASADSLPGDSLYSIKRGYEEARLALTFTEEGDQELLSQFAEERLWEIQALTEAGRVEDLDEAVSAFIDAMDRLEALSQEGAPGNSGGVNLGNNLGVLLGVLEKVPPQAQPAIQRAIERAAEHDLRKVEQQQNQAPDIPGSEERDERKQTAEQERDLRTAGQIAGKFGVSIEEVLATFEGQCEQNWPCVREHFRAQERKDKN